jgi:hypothetical protein
MDNLPYPESVSDWTRDTILGLVETNHQESSRIEYKKHLQYPTEESTKSRTEWRTNIEREFTAFANASGGYIVFGIADDVTPVPFNSPEHDVGSSVKQIVGDTEPHIDVEVGPEITLSDDSNKIVLPVYVPEAVRKPVSTKNSAYYVRSSDGKHPMSRNLIESLYVERNQRQQSLRRLEMEIDRFNQMYNSEFRGRSLTESTPNYQYIDIEALRDVLRDNSYLYSNYDVDSIIIAIFRLLREIDDESRTYGRIVAGTIPDDRSRGYLNQDMQRKLHNKARRLKEKIDLLSEQAELNV